MQTEQGRRQQQGAVPGAQAIGRALRVLRAVAAAPEGVTAAVAARSVGLARTTVVRLLQALEAERLVRINPLSGRYEVGPGVLELAGQYLARQDVRQLALPVLAELAQASRETVNLAIQDGLDSICIEQIESPHAVRAVNWIGRPLPVHATAVGKAWLAYQPGEVIEAVLARLRGPDGRLPACTPQTITDPAVLREELARTRLRGYAEAHEELEPWLTAVAAPVFDHAGSAAATIAVSGPTLRLSGDRIMELGRLTAASAQRLSAALGFRPFGSAQGKLGSAPEEAAGEPANGPAARPAPLIAHRSR